MEQRLSLITLGVADLGRARGFYERLGWNPHDGNAEDIVFFQTGSLVLALWDRDKLAADSCVAAGSGWGGVTLAHLVHSPSRVEEVMEEARAAGATIGREPAETFWGGYSGVFIDLDGHPWEVAHNPHWGLTAEGDVSLT